MELREDQSRSCVQMEHHAPTSRSPTSTCGPSLVAANGTAAVLRTPATPLHHSASRQAMPRRHMRQPRRRSTLHPPVTPHRRWQETSSLPSARRRKFPFPPSQSASSRTPRPSPLWPHTHSDRRSLAEILTHARRELQLTLKPT